MPMNRRTQAVGRFALCFGLAGWANLALTFVSPGAAGSRADATLRGSADLQRAAAPPQAEEHGAQPLARAAAFAATFAVAATMVSTPVQAEEGDVSVSSQYSQSQRKKKRREEASKEAIKSEKVEVKDGSNLGGLSLPGVPLPSLPTPPATFGEAKKPEKIESEAVPVKPFKKNFINPSDEKDYDEVSLAATNLPLAFAVLLGPSFVFIFFWVAGSLEII